MKKILAVFIVAVFLTGLAGSIGVDMPEPGSRQTSNISPESATRSATFTSLEITESEGYAVVTAPGCAMTTSEGKPMLPVWRTTIELPYGSRVTAVNMEHDPVRETRLHLPVRPARPASTPDMDTEVGERTPDPSIYESSSLYPKSWYTYDVACGLHDGERTTMVTVSVYPVRYSPGSNLLRSCRQADISVSYQPPSETLVGQDEHDLLVVCPRAWEASLERLEEHKESHGIATQVVCMECIKAGEYFPAEGRDDAETLKYFIKNAVEEWGIEYVLLVGGRIPGIQERWHLPVRYVHVYWADETRYASDLYFADLYNGSGMFSTWDTDGNDVFYEWGQYGSLKDRADLHPDVYLGRWACRTRAEVGIMVDKTITYENSQGSRRISLIGGDNFPQGDEIEGEVVCDKSLSYLEGFEASRVYASETDVTAAAIRETLDTGAMFLHMHGHGSPMSWSTHKPDNFDEWEKGIDVLDLPLLFNDEYTIALIGGCHTAMFNVSMTVHPWTGGVPSPEGTSWWLARKVGGGGIASLGYTAFPVATPGEEGDLDGDGVNEPDCVESGYGYMQLQVFDGYGNHDMDHLGACWSHAVTSYATHFKEPAEPYHLHTIQSFVLLGDPSLKIGGY
jgi:hypothetical protein